MYANIDAFALINPWHFALDISYLELVYELEYF